MNADECDQANAFAPNWGQTIFQSANEMNQNLLIKQRMAELQENLSSEKEWWITKRKGISQKLLQEEGVEEEAAPAPPPARKTGSSDDDAVLVDAGGPTAQAQGLGSVREKKKGKK